MILMALSCACRTVSTDRAVSAPAPDDVIRQRRRVSSISRPVCGRRRRWRGVLAKRCQRPARTSARAAPGRFEPPDQAHPSSRLQRQAAAWTERRQRLKMTRFGHWPTPARCLGRVASRKMPLTGDLGFPPMQLDQHQFPECRASYCATATRPSRPYRVSASWVECLDLPCKNAPRRAAYSATSPCLTTPNRR
jgi:hypothetical protein